MRQLATLIFTLFATLSACEGMEDPTMRATFFDKYTAPELGTTKFVDPALLPNPAPPPAPPFIPNIGVRGTQAKMIDISCEDKWATDVTVSIRTEYDRDPNTGNPAIGGPIIGTLQWGIGGGENQIEFDIPHARMPDNMAPAGNFPAAPMVLNGNGLQIYLAGTSHVSLSVRNDGSVSPLTTPGVNQIGFIARAKVIAHVSPGGSQRNPVERVITASTITSPLAVAGTVSVTIPPFAKSVRFERYNASQLVEPIQVLLFPFTGGNLLRIVTVGTNDEGPIQLSPVTGELLIRNVGASVVNQLNCVFDVTPT